MPTPTLYTAQQSVLFNQLPGELQGNSVDLLYVTDRTPQRDRQGRLMYSAGRSTSLAFGSAMVSLGGESGWEKLMRDSQQRSRSGRPSVRLKSLTETGRFPATPYPFTLYDGNYEPDRNSAAEFGRADAVLADEISRRLELTPRKELFLFIHGSDNTLEFALETWAGMWHFLGREGVPVVYSWPAGPGGAPLTSYHYDRESGEFTVFHLKQFIKSISSIEQVERIHIVAHSRGTDVITTAIRELFIEARASGVDMLQRYKFANLLLIAPDLDMEVVGQRLAAERLAEGIGQVTIYVSPTDRALGLASVLFSSVLRFGQIQTEEIPEQVKVGDHMKNITFIEAGKSQGLGHGYFYDNPAVSSDIILLLRYALPAGSRERPLIYIRRHFWKIPADYLKP
ncbi:MAG: alpha/beta hydrolase [Mariprofundaceae bacterium]|nr:alpha/beta hydrolase [Mariprofundaceae bacterium]